MRRQRRAQEAPHLRLVLDDQYQGSGRAHDGALIFVLLALAPQGRIVDAQDGGGLFHRLGGRDDRGDVRPLQLFQREAPADLGAPIAAARDALGKRGGLDDGGRPQDHRPLHRVAQLADVARPRVGAQHLLGRRRTGWARAVRPRARRKPGSGARTPATSSARSRSGGTRTSITFRRNSRSSRNRPACTSASRFAVGRRQDTHVGLARPRLADALELLLLQEAQQLRLQRQGQVADLVEEQRPALGGLDAPRLVADRARERALGVPEQLARQQLLGQRRRADGDERAFMALALKVHRAGEHALAGAVFAAKQHGRVRLRRARDDLQHGAHRRRARFEIDVRGLCREAALQIGQARGQRPLRVDLVHQVPDLSGRERLGQVVPGAAADRLHRGLHRRVGGDHDDGDVGVRRRAAGG